MLSLHEKDASQTHPTDEETDCCHTFNQSTHDLSQNTGKLRRRDTTLRCDPLQSHRTGCQSVPATRAPHRRSFGGKVQEHLPTDVCGILQSCEFIIHGARFNEEKHTGRWRTGNWPKRLRWTNSGEIVIMLLTLDRTCPSLAHLVTPRQVHTWFQTSFITTSQCCTISMMCERVVGLPAHLGRQL